MSKFDYDRLDALVAETGKSKSHLCRVLNKSRYYLRDAKLHDWELSDEVVSLIAAELGTTAPYLRGETDIKNASPKSGDALDRELLELFAKLSSEEKALILSAVKGIISARKE